MRVFRSDSQHTQLPWGVSRDLLPFPCPGPPRRVGADWLHLQTLCIACVAFHEGLWKSDINHPFHCTLTPRPSNTIPGTAQPQSTETQSHFGWKRASCSQAVRLGDSVSHPAVTSSLLNCGGNLLIFPWELGCPT